MTSDRADVATQAIGDERQRRRSMWEALVARGGPLGVAPSLLRELGIYGGAAGIWVNAPRTRQVSSGSSGVTVALLHTGKSYPDDLDDTGLLYHYPLTNRPGHDFAEVTATKAALALRLLVFVITPARDQRFRDVR